MTMFRRRAAFAAICALAGLASPAHAASFDCTKAATVREKTICADPDLSALDAALGVSFGKDLASASDTASASIRADQKAWLGELDEICPPQTGPRSWSNVSWFEGCLSVQYRIRKDQLDTEFRTHGPYDVYMVHRRVLAPQGRQGGDRSNT